MFSDRRNCNASCQLARQGELAIRATKREWAWAATASVLVLALTTLPYLAGYLAQTPDEIFAGAVFGRSDYATYLAAMHLGARGEWAFRFRFTSEPQQEVYVKQAYVVLGQAARLLGWTSPEGLARTYQLARWLFGLLACVAVYALMIQLFPGVVVGYNKVGYNKVGYNKARQAAFFLAVLGGGLGWLQLAAGWVPRSDLFPIDFWLVDGYMFFSLLLYPHFALVIACVAGMSAGFLAYLHRPRGWLLAAVAVFGVVAQFVNPFIPLLADLPLLGMVLGRACPWGRPQGEGRPQGGGRPQGSPLLAGVVVGVAQLPLLAYNLVIFNQNPLLAAFAAQNTTLSPPPVYYLWGYGLFWPLAAVGAWQVIRKPSVGGWGMLGWAAGALVLAYLPWQLQRRFLLIYTVPLGVLAVMGMCALAPWFAARALGWLTRRQNTLVLAYLTLAAAASLVWSLGYAARMPARPADLFDPADRVAAVDWLAAHAPPDAVVLSGVQTGLLVVARGGLVAFDAHPIETLDFPRKHAEARSFFSGELSPQTAAAWLATGRIEWVILDPRDPDSFPAPAAPAFFAALVQAGALTEAWRAGEVVVYRVNK